MTHRISSRASVESFKKEAKRWLKALRAGDVEAHKRLNAALPAYSGDVTLRTLQHALAREQGLPGWQALIDSLGVRERELRGIADEILRHAIFKGEPTIAVRLFLQHPEVAQIDLFTAVAAGNLNEVKRHLAADPAAASRAGGPHAWPPLLYLAYMRLPGSAPQSLDIARALLDCGADPNVRWHDEWGTHFTVLAGVIALGEGVKPPHECADELAELLLRRGADPRDVQVLYDTSIVSDDTHWLEVLWAHSDRLGLTSWWSTSQEKPIGGTIPSSPLDFMLGLAVSHRHLRRAEWLLVHGAHADGRQPYSGRRLSEEALVYGDEAMAALLAKQGAPDVPPQGLAAFQIACRKLDRAEARRLSELHPEYLLDAEVMLAAVREQRLDIIDVLLGLGVSVDVEDQGGIRALNIAAGTGAIDIVKRLIECGADIDKPTKHYGGPMGFAAHFGQRATAALLAPYSRDVHNLVYLGMKDRLKEILAAEPQLANQFHFREGFTPLFALPDPEPAALDMAQFLLGHGADPSLRDKGGTTPADAARKRGFTAVAELLS